MFKRRRPWKRWLAVLLLLLVIGSGLYWLDAALRPAFFRLAAYRTSQLATAVVNQAVQEELEAGNYQYQDFINVHQDQQGRVVLMQANTVRMNMFATRVSLAVNRRLASLPQQTVMLPLGLITGLTWLADYGPRLAVRILPAGELRVSWQDKFEAVGINQTRHVLALCLVTDIKLVAPVWNETVPLTTTVPVAESVVVGDVPRVYLGLPGWQTLEPAGK
ncbi:MAG: sporulation protein YunB [Desulfurispora sp.]|uniref:sporulation protein YunB n=1 Tax=Desulfurispora sp. TaxID=3014275 RepID=UPI0040498FED